MTGVALLLTAAAAGYLVARLLRLPAIPFLLVAGVVLAAVAPLEADILEDGLVLGVAFLLFLAGMELDPRRLGAQRRAALRVGAVQFVVLAALGFGGALALGFEVVGAAYLGLALTASSTLIGVRLLQRRQQMFEPHGRLVLGVLLLQDILVLLAIPFLAIPTGGWQEALPAAGGLAILGGLALLVRSRVSPLLLRFEEDEETVLLVALALLFAFLGLSRLLGLPIVVGAFLAGVSLSRFPVHGIVRLELAPIGDFFTALFFTALGGLIPLPTPEALAEALLFTALVVLLTPPLVTWMAERSGFAAKSAIEAGLLLSQTSEISLVIGLAGVLQGHIGPDVFVVIALVTFITMLLTPFLATDAVAWRLLHIHPYHRRMHREIDGTPPPLTGRYDRLGGDGGTAPEGRPSGHVLLLGAGATGLALVEDLIVASCQVVVVDDDPTICARLDQAGVVTVRGEASDPAVLRRAGADRARVVCSTLRRVRENEAVLSMAAGRPVLVRTFDEGDARWARERGGTPVLTSAASADGLMAWYEQEAPELEARLRERVGPAP